MTYAWEIAGMAKMDSTGKYDITMTTLVKNSKRPQVCFEVVYWHDRTMDVIYTGSNISDAKKAAFSKIDELESIEEYRKSMVNILENA